MFAKEMAVNPILTAACSSWAQWSMRRPEMA